MGYLPVCVSLIISTSVNIISSQLVSHQLICYAIEKRSNLTLTDFTQNYDGKWPVIIEDAVSSWPALKIWGREYLCGKYKNEHILMQSVSQGVKEGYAVTLDKFCSLLQEPSTQHKWYYLQDELFLHLHQELYKDLKPEPVYISNNYFKLFPPSISPWEIMLLWGTTGSRSTLHIDPYNWTGTNTVIYGKKKWRLIPPGQDEFLYVKQGVRCGFPLDCHKYESKVDLFDDNDLIKYSKLNEVVYSEIIQYPGETLIIPPSWFHQASNMEETLAVSGELLNNQNYKVVLTEMQKFMKETDHSFRPTADKIQLITPELEVSKFIENLPKDVLEGGKQITEQTLHLYRIPDDISGK